jgi:hypothetical protein
VSDDAKGAQKGGVKAWFAHAFAVEEYSAASLSEDERRTLDGLAEAIHKRGMTAAAILWIDSQRGMNWLGSQALVFAHPIYDLSRPIVNFILRLLRLGKPGFQLSLDDAEYKALAGALEKRYSIEYLIQRMEALEAGSGAGPAPAADEPQDLSGLR